MYCKNCGNQISANSSFCEKCGKQVEPAITNNIAPAFVQPNQAPMQTPVQAPAFVQPNQVPVQAPTFVQPNQAPMQQAYNGNAMYGSAPQNYGYNNMGNPPKKTYLGKISKIIGIIALVLVFIFQIFTIPLSIIGLVLGLKHREQTKEKTIGIYLNTISLLLAIPVFIVYSQWLLNPLNPVVGTWNCGSYDDSSNYDITLKLNRNSTFVWNKYGDEENNYVKGKFDFEDLNKTDDTNQFNYYSITLHGDEFVVNGKPRSEKYKSEYSIAVGSKSSKSNGEALLVNATTYNIYYCKLQK